MNKSGGAAAAAPAAGGGGGGGYTMAEVAKHTSKTDCWVVVEGQVLDVTSFLSEHPGGELAILTFDGKGAMEELNMIHPPDVITKYAPHVVIGMVGTAAAAAAPSAAASAAAPLLASHGKAPPADVRCSNRSKVDLDLGSSLSLVTGTSFLIRVMSSGFSAARLCYLVTACS